MTTEERYELIFGNTARAPRQMPEAPKKPKKENKNKKKSKVAGEWKNPATYVAIILLFIASVLYVTIFMGNVVLQREVTNMKVNLSVMQAKNDDREAEIRADVNFEEIRKIAIEKLGMRKPKSDHIIYYTGEEKDYVRQYGDIPE